MFTPAYARIARTSDGYTVRGFEGRTYRTIQGAKAAARYAEARDERAAVARIETDMHGHMVHGLAASFGWNSRGKRAARHVIPAPAAVVAPSYDADLDEVSCAF